MKRRALFWAGAGLLFVSGMLCCQLVPLFLVEVVGARLHSDIVDAQSMVDVDKPPGSFYVNAMLSVMYGMPFAVAGVYLVRRYRV